jgi:hypothetical protein
LDARGEREVIADFQLAIVDLIRAAASTEPFGALQTMSQVPIKVIAVLQLIGGVAGVVFLPWAQIPHVNVLVWPIAIIVLLINLLAVIAAIALWCEMSFGRAVSLAIQTIQLPKIMSAPLVFMFSFGLDVWVHASPSGVVGIQFSIFNNQLFLNVPNAPGAFGISITSIIALVILRKFQAERRPAKPLPPPPPNDWSDERAPKKSLNASGGS